MYSEEYLKKINNLRGIIKEYEVYGILSMFTSNEYNELIETMSYMECGKPYSDLDKSHKLWLNEFMYYDNYYLWKNSRPISNPKEIGDAFRLLAKQMSK